MPLGFLKSTILRNTEIRDVQHAVVIENYLKNGNGPELFDKIRDKWPIYYDMSRQERHRGLNIWRSPKEMVDNIAFNLCLINAGVDSGPHKEHTPHFREVHTQVLGYGKMQKFEENDLNTLYQEVILAPGITHEPFFDKDIVYPWHQYHAISDAVYMPIEINPL